MKTSLKSQLLAVVIPGSVIRPGFIVIASTHSGPPSPERRQMYDVKPGRATICLPLLPEDKNVLNAMLAKTVGVWMRPSAVVENMLGQLTASCGTNEDRL